MKRINPLLCLVVIFIASSCQTTADEIQVVCLPLNMTSTIIQGTETKKIIADFHYVAETKRIDHITWSNHQTHYFEYDGSDRLSILRQVKVDTKVQEEMWFHYDGVLVDQILLIHRNLDYIFLEPVDSTYTGYITFGYEGANIVEQVRYAVAVNGDKEIVWKAEYEYDASGNMVSSFTTDMKAGTSESVTMTYDKSTHPFSDLSYYFTGESFVNNLVTKTLVEKAFEYTYEFTLNEQGYPEIIYEKLGSANTRIIRYSYTCK